MEPANFHFVVKNTRKVDGSYAQGFGVGSLLRQSTLHMLVSWKQRNLPAVGLVVGEVPKLIFRGRKITYRRTFLLYSCNCHGFSRKIAPGVGLVVGEVPKLILRGRKITFRRPFLL